MSENYLSNLVLMAIWFVFHFPVVRVILYILICLCTYMGGSLKDKHRDYFTNSYVSFLPASLIVLPLLPS